MNEPTSPLFSSFGRELENRINDMVKQAIRELFAPLVEMAATQVGLGRPRHGGLPASSEDPKAKDEEARLEKERERKRASRKRGKAGKAEQLALTTTERPKWRDNEKKKRNEIPEPETELAKRGIELMAMAKGPARKMLSMEHVIKVLREHPDGLNCMEATKVTGLARGYFQNVQAQLRQAGLTRVTGAKMHTTYFLNKQKADKWEKDNVYEGMRGGDVVSVEVD